MLLFLQQGLTRSQDREYVWQSGEYLLIQASLTQMGLKNKEGKDIKDVWQDGIRTYLGMTFHGFPNCFMVYTPHGACYKCSDS